MQMFKFYGDYQQPIEIKLETRLEFLRTICSYLDTIYFPSNTTNQSKKLLNSDSGVRWGIIFLLQSHKRLLLKT